MKLEKLIGQQVTFHGTAKDAKGGAVLIIPNENVIYIKNLALWPSELEGKQVIVRGIIKKEKILPDPFTDKNGAISSGAIGVQFVLEKAKYSKAS